MSDERVVHQTGRGAFVGRQAELRRLHAAFEGAASGQGSLAMVVGEPGIGKTALCERLAVHVGESGGVTLVDHCYEEDSLPLPYLVFVEAMRGYVLGWDAEELGSQLGPGAADLAASISMLWSGDFGGALAPRGKTWSWPAESATVKRSTRPPG